MIRKSEKIIKIISGATISVVFLYFSFKDSNFHEITKIIKQANVTLLSISFVCFALGFVVKSYRWTLMGENFKGIPWIYFFKASSIGLMLNLFLPFRAGDLFQGYFLSVKTKLSKSYSLSTVLIERLVDFSMVVLMIIVGSWFVVFPESLHIQFLFVISSFAGFVVLVFLNYHKIILNVFTKTCPKKISHVICEFIDHFQLALKFFRNRKVLYQITMLTFFLWIVVYMVATYCILKSLGVDLSISKILLVVAISSLSAAIPSSPGQIGTFEFFCLISLSMFGVSQEKALSFAILSHILNMMPALIFGSYFLFDEVLIKKDLMSRTLFQTDLK